VSGSRLARTLTLIQWSQMGSLHAILGTSRTTASPRPGGSDRQVLEERASLFSLTRLLRLPCDRRREAFAWVNRLRFGLEFGFGYRTFSKVGDLETIDSGTEALLCYVYHA
jgi:hypothetical protein